MRSLFTVLGLTQAAHHPFQPEFNGHHFMHRPTLRMVLVNGSSDSPMIEQP
jgi:hypothetical protein